MWASRPVGQLEKCAEAGALRRAFPEEIGNDLTAEEMEGQHIIDDAAHAPEKPKPETVTPPSAGGERKPLPPLVSQPQSPTAPAPVELSEPFAARQARRPRNPPCLRAHTLNEELYSLQKGRGQHLDLSPKEDIRSDEQSMLFDDLFLRTQLQLRHVARPY